MIQTRWISTFTTTSIIVFISMITSVLLARALGADERGALIILTFWPSMIVGVFYFSQNESTAYHLSQARAEGGLSFYNHQCKAALCLHIITALLVTILSPFVIQAVLGSEQDHRLQTSMVYVTFFVPLTIMCLYYNAVFQGRGDIRSLNVFRLLQPVAYAGMLVMLFVCQSLRVETALIASVLSLAVSVIVGSYVAGPCLPRWDLVTVRKIARTSLSIHGANLLLYVASEVDKMIVIKLMSKNSVGIYGVSSAVGSIATAVVVQSLILSIYQKIGACTKADDRVAYLCNYVKVAMLLLLFCNGVASLCVHWAILVLFGQEFEAAIPVTLILLLMNFFRGIRQIADRGLRATLNPRLGMWSEGVGLLCFVTMAPLASSLGGLIGVAWAAAAAQAFALVVIIAGICRTHKVSFLRLWGLGPSTFSWVFNVMLGECRILQQRWFR